MISRRARNRDEHRRRPEGGQFGDGHRPRPRDDEIRGAIERVHVRHEVQNHGPRTLGRIGGADPVDLRGPRHMDDLQARGRPVEGLDDALIQRFGSLAAADDRQGRTRLVQSKAAERLAAREAPELAPDRASGHQGLPAAPRERRASLGPLHVEAGGARGEETVGLAGPDVLLEEDVGNAQRPGGDGGRHRAVAADTDQDIGLELADSTRGSQDGPGQGTEESGEPPPAGRFQGLEGDVLPGQLGGVERPGGAEPVDPGAFGVLDEGYTGEDMATGAAPGEQDTASPSGHVPLSVALAMFTSIPTPASVNITEDPPALTNGSGMPLVGMAAVTTATFIAA